MCRFFSLVLESLNRGLLKLNLIFLMCAVCAHCSFIVFSASVLVMIIILLMKFGSSDCWRDLCDLYSLGHPLLAYLLTNWTSRSCLSKSICFSLLSKFSSLWFSLFLRCRVVLFYLVILIYLIVSVGLSQYFHSIT